MPSTSYAFLGQCTAVVGAQWGDEGKGKLIDILTEQFDVVARACGGANAGHTIVVGGEKHVFRLMPSGALHQDKPVILGGGMVIHLPTLLEEIELLEKAGIEILKRLKIAPNAHIVFNFHKEVDGAMEELRAVTLGKAIGTTKRGIGPAYADKMLRRGLRIDALKGDPAEAKAWLEYRQTDVQSSHGIIVDVKTELSEFRRAKTVLEKCVIDDLPSHMAGYFANAKSVLIEGAQATLLDIDHGTYPYVTSSSTTAAGALQGLGLPPAALSSCVGVAKAYCTRVGEGTFLTEVTGETADRLRKRGGEYGSVTKRPRRCGWLHIPDLTRAALINGFDSWNITKLDVLDEEAEVPVGIGINPDGTPQYQVFPGWKTSTLGITQFDQLPENARTLLDFIQTKTGIPVRFVGTGQKREEMIVR